MPPWALSAMEPQAPTLDDGQALKIGARTHQGKQAVFPLTRQRDDGGLETLDPDTAFAEAVQRGDFVAVDRPEEVESFAEGIFVEVEKAQKKEAVRRRLLQAQADADRQSTRDKLIEADRSRGAANVLIDAQRQVDEVTQERTAIQIVTDLAQDIIPEPGSLLSVDLDAAAAQARGAASAMSPITPEIEAQFFEGLRESPEHTAAFLGDLSEEIGESLGVEPGGLFRQLEEELIELRPDNRPGDPEGAGERLARGLGNVLGRLPEYAVAIRGAGMVAGQAGVEGSRAFSQDADTATVASEILRGAVLGYVNKVTSDFSLALRSPANAVAGATDAVARGASGQSAIEEGVLQGSLSAIGPLRSQRALEIRAGDQFGQLARNLRREAELHAAAAEVVPPPVKPSDLSPDGVVRPSETPLDSASEVTHVVTDSTGAPRQVTEKLADPDPLYPPAADPRERAAAEGFVDDSPLMRESGDPDLPRPDGVEPPPDPNGNRRMDRVGWSSIFRTSRPRTPRAHKELVRRSNIVHEMSQLLDVVIRGGRRMGGLKKKALGFVFRRGQEVIRLRSIQDVQTLFHEIGHLIDKRVFSRGRISGRTFRGFEDELGPIATQPRAGQSPLPEGFAEFVSFYVTDPLAAVTAAPRFHAHFEAKLHAEAPEVLDILLKGRRDWARFQQQNDVDQLKSIIHFHERAWAGNPNFDIYTNLWHQYAPLDRALRQIEGPEKRNWYGRREPWSNANVLDQPGVLAQINQGYLAQAMAFVEPGRGALDFNTAEFIRRDLTLGDAISGVPRHQYEDLMTYMVGRRLQQLHRNPKRKVRQEDLPLEIEKIDNAVAALDSPPFREAAEKFDEVMKAALKYLHDSGAIRPDVMQKIVELDELGIPLHRLGQEPLASSGNTKVNEFGDTWDPIRRVMKSSTDDIVNPMDTAIKNIISYVQLAHQHEIASAYRRLGLKQKQGAARLWEEIPADKVPQFISKQEADRLLDRLLSPEQREMLGDIEIPDTVLTAFRPAMLKNGEMIMAVRGEDGKIKYGQVADPQLYDAMMGLGRDGLNRFTRIIGEPDRWLRAGAIGDPSFLGGTNPVRDQITAGVFSKHGYMPVFDLLRMSLHLLRNSDVAERGMSSGLAMANFADVDRHYASMETNRIVERSMKGPGPVRIGSHRPGRGFNVYAPNQAVRRALGVIRNPLEAWRAFGSLIENATRLGEFERARKANLKKGVTGRENIKRSGFAGRDVTIDFQRIGAKTQSVAYSAAFWNARMQGADKMRRAFADDPVGTTAKSIISITFPHMLSYLAQHDNPVYQELADWEKDVYTPIIAGHVDEETWAGMSTEEKYEWTQQHPIYRIPSAHEQGAVFGPMIRRGFEWYKTEDPEGFQEFVTTTLANFAVGFAPLPVMVSAPFQYMLNHNLFRGAPEVSRSLEGLDDELEFNGKTSRIARDLGRATGLSPIRFEAAVRNTTGGSGRLFLRAMDHVYRNTRYADEGVAEWPANERPIINRLVSSFPLAQTKSVNDFYEYHVDALQKNRSWRRLENIALIQENEASRVRAFRDADEYFDKHEEKILNSRFTSTVAKQMSAYRLMEQGTLFNQELTDEQKNKATGILRLEIIDLAREANQYLRPRREDETEP